MKAKKEAKIKMFATANDTDVYVLAIDGYFGYLTRSQAYSAYEKIGYIDDSPFGSAQVLPPQYYPKDYQGNDMHEGRKVSDFMPIDILDYINKKLARSCNYEHVHHNCLTDYRIRKEIKKLGWFI